MTEQSHFDELVEDLKVKTQDAETLRVIAGRNPDLIVALAKELGNGSRQRRPGDKTQMESIVDFLRSQTEPVGTLRIAKGTGIEQSAVRTILYANKGRTFSSVKHPDHSSKRLWKLVDEKSPTKRGTDRSSPSDDESRGPTAAILRFLRRHPEGALASTIMEGVINEVETESEDKKALIYGTLTQLRKRGRLVAIKIGDTPKVYKFVTDSHGAK